MSSNGTISSTQHDDPAEVARALSVPFTEQVSALSPLNGGALDGSADAPAIPPRGQSVLIRLSRLHAHPDNIREVRPEDVQEMAAGMRVHGVLQPLIVTPHPVKAGHYEILAGHHRAAAAEQARLKEVPCLIRHVSIGSLSAIQIMLIENCHRIELATMDKAVAMGKLRDGGMSNIQIAKACGFTDATVSTYLSLLELDKGSQDRVREGSLPVTEAIRAVRQVRARTPGKGGGRNQREAAALTWEPDHFTSRHPLARKAAALCDARDHNLRRRLGKTACGACWEAVIRSDECLVVAGDE